MTTEADNSQAIPPFQLGMALLWPVLFGGRWIVVSLLQWNSLLSPETVSRLDTGTPGNAPAFWYDGLLLRTYLILLFVTILFAALNLTRRLQSGASITKSQNAAETIGAKESAT